MPQKKRYRYIPPLSSASLDSKPSVSYNTKILDEIRFSKALWLSTKSKHHRHIVVINLGPVGDD